VVALSYSYGQSHSSAYLRVNSYKNVTEGESLTQLEMLPRERRLLSISLVEWPWVLP